MGQGGLRRHGMDARHKLRDYPAVWALLGAFLALAAIVLALCLRYAGSAPDNAGRALTQEELAGIIARNSPLTEYAYLSPNADFPREGKIDTITIHHMADDSLSLETLGKAFADIDRQASSNYAIDRDGRVALYVEEANRAWTSSSPENDHRAVTIEVANDEMGGQWHVSDTSYNALIELCADICRRNGIEKLTYTGDAAGNLTIHKMFNEKTECPGPYLEGRMEEIAEAVNRMLDAPDQIE